MIRVVGRGTRRRGRTAAAGRWPPPPARGRRPATRDTRAPAFVFPEDRSLHGIFTVASNVDKGCDDWYQREMHHCYDAGELRPPVSGEKRVVRGGTSWGRQKLWFRCARAAAPHPTQQRALGYALPKARTARDFLERFHDETLELARPPRAQQKSFLLPASQPVQALQQVQAGLVQNVAQVQAQQGEALTIATIDQDATIIESHKEAAQPHYEGGRGYQPMVAVWAEADLVVADEFRDGNGPARQAPLTCAQAAFAALPASVKQRYFRGDSACHEAELLGWLRHPDRAREPGGAIGFAVSAVLSVELAAAVAAVPEKEWVTFGIEADGTRRQWAEVPFVPGEAREKKDTQPLRYVGLRLLMPQGVLFADGSDRHHHAVVTNLPWEGGRLLQWHREKAGTVEHVQDEVKNGLGGGHVPSQHFHANAAWFKIALLAYNVVSAIRRLALGAEERDVRLKKFRLLVVRLGGRMSRCQCTLRLRLCAPPEAIARLQRIWAVFALPTQATAFR